MMRVLLDFLPPPSLGLTRSGALMPTVAPQLAKLLANQPEKIFGAV